MKIEKPLSDAQNRNLDALLGATEELSNDAYMAGLEIAYVLKTAQKVAVGELRMANPLRLRGFDLPNATVSEFDAQCLNEAAAILKRIRKQAALVAKSINRIPQDA